VPGGFCSVLDYADTFENLLLPNPLLTFHSFGSCDVISLHLMDLNRCSSRRSFLATLGTAAMATPFIAHGVMSRPPNSVLRHASFGASGMAWADLTELAKYKLVDLVAVAEVDLNRTAALKKRFPQTRIYQDWRELLDKEGKHIDSVNVSTPDHMHAVMAFSAMQMGKHVYGQKPLAHDLYEVRRLTEFPRHKELVTQMGIQIHSSSHYRLASVLVQAGAIGKVKEVHCWVGRTWGDPGPRPEHTDPVPPGLDWDLWLGVCASRPFIGNGYYHPANWRKRLDFGTGSLGDMGCHIFDPVFDALGLTAPLSVRSEGPAPNQWNWAIDSLIHYVFPGTAHTASPTLNVTWYDGAQKPPPEVRALLEGDDLPQNGSIFIGTNGAMVLPHVSRPLLYPDKKFTGLKFPEVASDDHWGEFVRACLGHGRTSAGFSYAGPLTEAVLLGCVASRFPQTTLKWNPATMEFNEQAANPFVRRQYRQGWGVPGLSI
jgi:predicted dehydrogenase